MKRLPVLDDIQDKILTESSHRKDRSSILKEKNYRPSDLIELGCNFVRRWVKRAESRSAFSKSILQWKCNKNDTH